MRVGPPQYLPLMVMGLVVFLCACLVGAPGAVAAPRDSSMAAMDDDVAPHPVVVIGFSGMTWAYISEEETPNLWKFAQGAAGANNVVHAIREITCPSEGWLTLGAGQRAQDAPGSCRALEEPSATAAGTSHTVAHWQDYLAENVNNQYGVKLGVLGSALKQEAMLAIGPGAALALADPEGQLHADYVPLGVLPGSVAGSDASAADPDREAAAAAYAANAEGKNLTVVDLGSVRYPDAPLTPTIATGDNNLGWTHDIAKALSAAFRTLPSAPEPVLQQVRALDARFGALLQEIEAKTPSASVIAVSVADSQMGVAELGFFAARGPDLDGVSEIPRLAMSDATRQRGLVQTTDILPTVLAWSAPDSPAQQYAVGSPIVGATSFDSVAHLADRLTSDNQRSMAVRPLTGPWYILMVVSAVVVTIAGVRRMRRANAKKLDRAATQNFIQACAMVAALPVSALLVNLVPWWRFTYPALGFFGGVIVLAGIISLIAAHSWWRDRVRSPVVVVAAVTAVTLALDVSIDRFFSGYPLQLSSVFNLPQVGGRYFGFSNATFTMFTVSALFAAAYCGELLIRRNKTLLGIVIVVVIGSATLLLDGSAEFGADFGGPPAIIVGFFALVMMLLRIPFTLPRVLMVLGVAIAGSLGFAVIDYLRPPEQRSHLGRFIQTLLNGGGFEVISRKLSSAFFGLPWTLIAILLIVMAVGVFALWRLRLGDLLRRRYTSRFEGTAGLATWRDISMFRDSLVASSAAMVVGLVINDSSIVIPTLGLAMCLPLWCAMVSRNYESFVQKDGSGASSDDPAGSDDPADGDDTADGVNLAEGVSR